MIKTITKIGNSQGIIFDSALMDLAHLKVGDQVNVAIHNGGTVILERISNGPTREEISATIQETVKDYAKTLRKLA
jgi:antitoxin component of MazEF toxin-antitoxin module